MIDFNGQAAIVTGAGRGMGREIALLLARRGAKVLVNDYGGDPEGHAGTSKEAEAVAEEIRRANGIAVADATTVGDSAGADRIIAAALEAFGRIDILINNAGGSTIAPIDELSDEAIERVMRTNYWGPYLLIRRAWPHMRKQGYGRILNVSSSATLGIGTVAPYSSAKAAMIGLTCEAAIEGKPHGIGINAIFPAGYTRLAAKSQEAARVWMETYFAPQLRRAGSRLFRQSRDAADRRDLRSRWRARLTYRLFQQRWLLQSGAHAGVGGGAHGGDPQSRQVRSRRQLHGRKHALHAMAALDGRTRRHFLNRTVLLQRRHNSSCNPSCGSAAQQRASAGDWLARFRMQNARIINLSRSTHPDFETVHLDLTRPETYAHVQRHFET